MIHFSGASPHYPLVALLCGFEKSGTTLLNEILRRHPDLDSGFEVGMLLGQSPREFSQFQPYFAFFRRTWELQRADLDYICDTDDWSVAYARARERSPVIVDKDVGIFDKTPIYMRELSAVLARVPGIPCVVNVRDPRALFLSWANWSGARDNPAAWLEENFARQVARYTEYGRGYRVASLQYGDRLLLNQFERMCLNPEPVCREIFDFLGLGFESAYLEFSSRHFVYGNKVSDEYIHPYRGVLPESLCQRILEATSEFSDWHYHS